MLQGDFFSIFLLLMWADFLDSVQNHNSKQNEKKLMLKNLFV